MRPVRRDHGGRQAAVAHRSRRPPGRGQRLVQFTAATETATVVDVAPGVRYKMLGRVHICYRVIGQVTVFRPQSDDGRPVARSDTRAPVTYCRARKQGGDMRCQAPLKKSSAPIVGTPEKCLANISSKIEITA